MKGTPDRPIAIDQHIDCTPLPPLADSLIALPALIRGVTWVAESAGKTCSESPCGPTVATTLGIVLIVVGALYGASAVHGFHKVEECRQVTRDSSIASMATWRHAGSSKQARRLHRGNRHRSPSCLESTPLARTAFSSRRPGRSC
jgi:hypothetical protein